LQDNSFFWPVRLGVRTPDFHSGNRGSIPLRATKFHIKTFKSLQINVCRLFCCAPGMGDNSRVQVPNTPLQLEVLAEGKGVHREVESEGSIRQFNVKLVLGVPVSKSGQAYDLGIALGDIFTK
jgi:hypothetical protein